MNKLTKIGTTLGAGLLLWGCSPASPASGPSSTTTATQTTTATATTTATQTSVAPAPSSSAPTAPASTQPSSTSAQVPECNSQNLALTHAPDPDGTGAGHSGFKLTVKALGFDCLLSASPAIMFTTGPQDPQQIGSAATYDQGRGEPFVLRQGQTASAQISVSNPGNYPNCEPVTAWGIAIGTVGNGRVYSPGDNLRTCGNGNLMMIKAKPFQLD